MVSSSLATRVGLAIFEYDFAVDAGAQGAIIIGANRIPAGSILLDGIIWIVTAPTSEGSATVAISALGANDLLTATAIASLTLNSFHDIVPVCTAATVLRATASIGCTFTVATADLTAGKIAVAIRYVDLA
jgi:hypothetical protein